MANQSNKFSTINESSLHRSLKEWLSEPGDQFEVEVEGYVIDIVRDSLLIEIQTRNFTAIKKKLSELIKSHHVRLVNPVVGTKWIVKLKDGSGNSFTRRKSPKRGDYLNIFTELVSFPEILMNRRFSLELVLIEEEEILRQHRSGSWRRKGWKTVDRRLLDILDRRLIANPRDILDLVEMNFKAPFTTLDMAKTLHKPRWLCQKIAYCLKKMELIKPIDRTGKGVVYIL